MKTRILKKITERIRIIEQNDMFIVQHRQKFAFGKFDEWKNLNQFNSYKKALEKKHSYIIMILMRDFGYRNEFVKRRTKK
jgi:hypothetical protein